MKKLTKKSHWDKAHQSRIKKIFNINILSANSFYLLDFSDKIKPFLKPGLKTIEIGCAPGNNLIGLAKKFKLKPYGVEYSEIGCSLTKDNFRNNGFNPDCIFCDDFFSKSFQKEHKGRYDVVCSFGFIEHFDDIDYVIKCHINLLKKNGILIICIPNLKRFNSIFVPKHLLDKHNLNIMDLNSLNLILKTKIEVAKLSYFGGLFNVGLFYYDNKFIEYVRLLIFVFQRLVFDPIFYLFMKVGLRLDNKFTSPAIVIVGRKK